MKSPLRRRISPSVPFTLTFEDETGVVSLSYKLAYNINSLVLIEEQLGVSMLTDCGEIVDSPTAKNVSVLLWAALQEYQPEYEGLEGLENIRQNLTVSHTKDALNACFDAYVKQLPPEQQARVLALKAKREAGEIVAADPLATTAPVTPTAA
jgi:hypothetical protein